MSETRWTSIFLKGILSVQGLPSGAEVSVQKVSPTVPVLNPGGLEEKETHTYLDEVLASGVEHLLRLGAG